MAGSERSGPLAASAALFDGRPWAITPDDDGGPGAVALVEALAELCGAVPVRLSPEEHDQAVARTSHLPHLLAALAAGRARRRARRAPRAVRAGRPRRHPDRRRRPGALRADRRGQRRPPSGELLTELRDRLDGAIAALDGGDRGALEALLRLGVDGTRAIPGKHGGPVRPTGAVYVAVPDHPGELARLFADAGESGVNIEDVRIDHDPGRPVGLVELTVEEGRAEQLLDALGISGLGDPQVGCAAS